MPYEIAESIILAKDYVGGPDMRGRQSMSPLRKLGLVYIDENEKVLWVSADKLNYKRNNW